MSSSGLATAPRPTMLATGFVAGCLSGLLGIGGGLVVGPILILRGLTLRMATGTALAMIPGVALVGAITEQVQGAISMPWGLVLAVALGGPIGLRLGQAISRRLSDQKLWVAFLLLLAITMVRLVWPTEGHSGQGGWLPAGSSLAFAIAIAAGCFAGIAAVLFGVGGGILVVPILAFSLPELGFAEASAVSLAAMVPTTSLGLVEVWKSQRLAKPWLWPLLCGGAPGAVCGVLLRGQVLSPRTLELVFAAFLLYVLLRLWQGRAARA